MRTIISIIILAFAIQVRADLVQSYSLLSYVAGKRFTSTVTRDQLLKSPAWSLQDDLPPLSPRKADRLATAKFHELLKDTKDWRRDRISLEDMGDGIHWIYVVEFGYHGDIGGLMIPYKILILMDGTVVEPKVSDEKKSAS
jgi:hypothetical protein